MGRGCYASSDRKVFYQGEVSSSNFFYDITFILGYKEEEIKRKIDLWA